MWGSAPTPRLGGDSGVHRPRAAPLAGGRVRARLALRNVTVRLAIHVQRGDNFADYSYRSASTGSSRDARIAG